MSETLYRKYRPLTFDSVVGQQHIVTTLQNAIKSSRLSHAYMFCGPRGTGKTTMARILAKACVCADPGKDIAGHTKKLPTDTPCGQCQECNDVASGNHPDVYELDAASRTGVENVREEIIGRVNFAATRGNSKIYIIDEVHMLSIAAFNALLKTLEEAPEHVVFVLCTTDPQKVPETVLSRCQRFDFRPISDDDIAERLKFVCKEEGVKAQPNALGVIAGAANGGMRNALTILEQMISFCEGSITISKVRKNLGASADIDITGLVKAISDKNLSAAYNWIDKYCSAGADFVQLTETCMLWARDQYIGVATKKQKSQFTKEALHFMIVELGELQKNLKTCTNTKLAFEVCVAKLTLPATVSSIESLSARIANIEQKGISVTATYQVPVNPIVEESMDKNIPIQQDTMLPIEDIDDAPQIFSEDSEDETDIAQNKPKHQFNGNEDQNLTQEKVVTDISEEGSDKEINVTELEEEPLSTIEDPPTEIDPVAKADSLFGKMQPDVSLKNSEESELINSAQDDNEQDSLETLQLNNDEKELFAVDNDDNTKDNDDDTNDNDDDLWSQDVAEPIIDSIQNNDTDINTETEIEDDGEDVNSKDTEQDNQGQHINSSETNNNKSFKLPEISDSDLANEKTLAKVWHNAYAVFKRRYPGYGAFLLTSNAIYRPGTNQVVIQFPASQQFAADTIGDPSIIENIAQAITEVAGKEVGVDVEVVEEIEDTFDPVPQLKPTEEQKQHSKEIKEKSVVTNDDMKDILSSFGATKITED